MKFEQKKTFEPITITFETADEAEHFLGFVDKIEKQHTYEMGSYMYITKAEFAIAKEISDAFTNCLVRVY